MSLSDRLTLASDSTIIPLVKASQLSLPTSPTFAKINA